MGRVLCVTDQVPSSHSRAGEAKEVEEGSMGLYFRGERRLIRGAEGWREGGTSTTIVVPPGDSPGCIDVSAILETILVMCVRVCDIGETIQ